jgi:hypothetical protein
MVTDLRQARCRPGGPTADRRGNTRTLRLDRRHGQKPNDDLRHACPRWISGIPTRTTRLASTSPRSSVATRNGPSRWWLPATPPTTTCTCTSPSPRGWREWIAALDKIESPRPRAVVAGHKRAGNDDDPRIIEETRKYIRDFDHLVEETATARELYDAMRSPARAEATDQAVEEWSWGPADFPIRAPNEVVEARRSRVPVSRPRAHLPVGATCWPSHRCHARSGHQQLRLAVIGWSRLPFTDVRPGPRGRHPIEQGAILARPRGRAEESRAGTSAEGGPK